MDASDAKRLRALEEENNKLKRLLVETVLDNTALKELLSKTWQGPPLNEKLSPVFVTRSR